jgi:hypothetical protein
VVNNPAAVLQLQTQGGNDKVDIAALSQNAQVDTGDGNDTVTVGYGFNKLDAITAGLVVKAGAGFDQVNVTDQQTAMGQTYTLTNGTLQRTGAGPISFDTTLETLSLVTSNQADDIFVQATPVAGTTNIQGNLGSDRLTGPNVDTTWTVTGLNAGTLGGNINFAGVESLRGGTANDRFLFANGQGVSGTVEGNGGSSNTLDYSAYTTPVVFDVQLKTANNIGGWNGINEFVGGSASDQIIGPNLPNTWQVKGVNSGQLSTLALGLIKFSGVENLKGGIFGDAFMIGSAGQLTGTINGDGGSDTIDYGQSGATMSVRVNLLTGKATNIAGGISGIENAAGGNGDDILVGNAAANQLVGGSGRDLLIGGLGSDILQGGAHDDLLIGGMTLFQYDGVEQDRGRVVFGDRLV